MARVRNYLETDVLTEARARLRHTFEIFDTIAVMFSGGKDSLAVLHLTREIAKEFGQKVVNVVFRDEELIPDPVIDFVDKYRRLPWVNMTWYAYPLKSTEYVLGVSRSCTEVELKAAFRKLAMQHHPDRNPGNDDCVHKFKELNEAYDVLKHGDQRAA